MMNQPAVICTICQWCQSKGHEAGSFLDGNTSADPITEQRSTALLAIEVFLWTTKMAATDVELLLLNLLSCQY